MGSAPQGAGSAPSARQTDPEDRERHQSLRLHQPAAGRLRLQLHRPEPPAAGTGPDRFSGCDASSLMLQRGAGGGGGGDGEREKERDGERGEEMERERERKDEGREGWGERVK